MPVDAHTVATLSLTFITVALLYLVWYFHQTYQYWKTRKIPYIKPTIPFGNLRKVYTKKCQLGEVFAEVYDELKKMGAKHGGAYAVNSPVYVPVDPTIIKHILINDASNFINHGYYQNSEIDPLSAHIFNMEGNQWKNVRSKTTHAFTLAKLKKMFVTLVEMSKDFEKHLEICREKYPEGIEIKKATTKLTTDNIMKTAYGMDTNTLKGENKKLLHELDNFMLDQWSVYKYTMVFLFPRNILEFLQFKLFPKETTEFARKLFLDLQRYRKEFNVHLDDLADILISMTEKKENQDSNMSNGSMKPLTENEFIAQTWVFIGAGAESTAATVSFALYELSKNPECQNKLREEIRSVLAKHNNELTFDVLKEMTYLDNVFNETMRLYPILPVILRLCGNDYKVPGTDFVLAKNTGVIISNYGIQRDPEYFPDPSKFDPERFTSENRATRPSITHLYFGEGPRICPGKKFAILQMKVGLLTIIKNYIVSLSDKTTPEFQFAPWELILRKNGDIWVQLEKIN